MNYQPDPEIIYRDAPIDEARARIAVIASEIQWEGLNYSTDFANDAEIDSVILSAYTDYPDVVLFQLTDGQELLLLGPDLEPVTKEDMAAILQIDDTTATEILTILGPALETAKARYKNN